MLTWAEKLLNKSEEMENLGDFEREYIFGVSYITTMMALRKSKEYRSDKAFYDRLSTMQKLIPKMERIEEVKKDLEKLYSDYEAAQKAKDMEQKHEQAIRQEKIKKAQEASKDFTDILETYSRSITPENLVKLLRNHVTDLNKVGGILILDIRKRDEFNRNRIDFSQKGIGFILKFLFSNMCRKFLTVCFVTFKTKKGWFRPFYVHIPIENATPGVIGTKLAQNSLLSDGYENRHRYRLVILLSWKSSSIDITGPDTEPLKCVYNALTKFDTPATCKNVIVMDGGLFEWMSLYPHLMTDPTAGAPKAQFTHSTILQNAQSITYDSAKSVLNPPQPKPKISKPVIRPVHSQTPPSPSKEVEETAIKRLQALQVCQKMNILRELEI